MHNTITWSYRPATLIQAIEFYAKSLGGERAIAVIETIALVGISTVDLFALADVTRLRTGRLHLPHAPVRTS